MNVKHQFNWQHSSFPSNFLLLSTSVMDGPRFQGWPYGQGCLLVIKCNQELVTMSKSQYTDKITMTWMVHALSLGSKCMDGLISEAQWRVECLDMILKGGLGRYSDKVTGWEGVSVGAHCCCKYSYKEKEEWQWIRQWLVHAVHRKSVSFNSPGGNKGIENIPSCREWWTIIIRSIFFLGDQCLWEVLLPARKFSKNSNDINF